jgi:hypothetical protein
MRATRIPLAASADGNGKTSVRSREWTTSTSNVTLQKGTKEKLSFVIFEVCSL